MTQELVIIEQFGISKSERKNFAVAIVDSIEAGEVDPLKIHVQVKSIEDILNRLTDNKKYPETANKYRASLLNTAMQNGKKFDYQNGKFEIKEAGVKYDYSQCGDEVLNTMYAKQEKLDNAVKERETFLKTVPVKGLVITDEETGETITVYPPSKTSSTTVQVTLL